MCNFNEYNKSLCCGCGACELVCPKKCIKMIYDEEGFLYPILDKELCIHCGLCEIHCPIIKETKNNKVLFSYGLIHRENNITKNSSSGGAFTAIAEYVLSNDGVVFGCAFNENIEAKTICIESRTDLYKLRGSKYVQCDTNKQYKNIKTFLDKGRIVLYCSTPCQIAGLKSYLSKDYDNLFLIDLFCHGTPSPKLFEKYITWLGEKYGSKISNYCFRDKKYGWSAKGYFKTEFNHEYELNGSDPYYYSFLMGRTYRPVCYQCKYANPQRTGDITIGDFWGVEKNHPNINTEEGVSAVLINNLKGQKVLDYIKIAFIYLVPNLKILLIITHSYYILLKKI